MDKKDNSPHFCRRSLLKGVLGGAAMYALAPIRPLLAQSAAGHRFVACFLDGGWDVLLAGKGLALEAGLLLLL